ncbi:hypothetical protein CEK26_001930 [Fusarium fujikuroi]|nr:hypothetical protein CEK27_001927 [Fusarium fujikuroi]QGI77004.1 hypothetical protein CEK25_001910 [Fusarium fujikuroi]QGI90715.1 hypothetical protein CEK26_001930 [Fusarium fujikuroi]
MSIPLPHAEFQSEWDHYDSKVNPGQQAFEGLLAHRTARNRILIFRPASHSSRFRHSASVVSMPPVPESLFLACVHMAVARNAEFVPPHNFAGNMYIRPLEFGSSAQIGLDVPDEFTFCVFVQPHVPLHGHTPLRALVAEEFDRAATRGTGNCKVGGNYGPVLKWSKDAKKPENGGWSALLHVDSKTQSYVDEFSAAALIGVKSPDQESTQVPILTVAHSEAAIHSITAESVVTIAQSFGWTVERRLVKLEELSSFSEVFAVGTAATIRPCSLIYHRSTGKHFTFTSDGPYYQRLWKTLSGIQKDANERRKAQNRVAQRNYRSRQKLRVELAEAILYDMPSWRTAVGLKRKRWLETPQSVEDHDTNPDSATPKPSLSSQVIQYHEEGQLVQNPTDFSMSADADVTADVSSGGESSDLSLGVFTPGDDWINAEIDWTAAMTLAGDTSASEPDLRHRAVGPGNDIHAQPPVSIPVQAASGQHRTLTAPTPAESMSLRTEPPETAVITVTSNREVPNLGDSNEGSRSISTTKQPSEFKTPVLTAIAKGKLDIARLLISSGANIDTRDMHGRTNLHYAVSRSDAKTVRSLLELGADLLMSDASGVTALHMAVGADDQDMVKLLLGWCEQQDRTASSTDHKTTLKQCINSRDGQNMTPLHLCVVMERMDMLKILLDYGADVNIGCD